VTNAADAAPTGAEWFEEWFGEEYLELYPHRDESEAERAVDLIVAHAADRAGGRALDLACGAGRHVERLRESGFRAFGLDLSLPLLRRARAEGVPAIRADMRVLPVTSGSLDLVTSFFTSFGYFPDAADDRRVLGEIHRVLAPGGRFAVDFLNAQRVRDELRPRDEVELGLRRFVQTRRLVDGGRVVEKRIEIYDAGRREPRVFHERVRLYAADELAALLESAGIEPFASFGDYSGAPVGPGTPRVILLGRTR
jgi:SAM-dependent methyltransferase